MDPADTRVPLPASVALAIPEQGEALLHRVDWTTSDPSLDLLLLRACVAVITAYVFFNRGECGALVMSEDLYVDDTHITLLLSNEKGKKGVRTKTVRQNPRCQPAASGRAPESLLQGVCTPWALQAPLGPVTL